MNRANSPSIIAVVLNLSLLLILTATAVIVLATLWAEPLSSGEIVFNASLTVPSNSEIVRVDLATGMMFDLSRYPESKDHARWSHDGRDVIFVANRGRQQNIFMVDHLGANLRSLTGGLDSSTQPALSPDKRKLAYVYSLAFDFHNREVYILDLETRQTMNVSGSLADDFNPLWSPDGSQLVFVSDRPGDPQADPSRGGKTSLFLVNADGSNLRWLTTSQFNDSAPAWSPDGRSIAFVSDRVNGYLDIFLVSLETGGTVRQLTNFPEDDARPVWSPDGEHIAYVSRRNKQIDIYVMDLNGNHTQVTDSPVDDISPAWSPDGEWLAFVSTREGLRALYVVHRSGSGLRRVTPPGLLASEPMWRP